MNSNFGPCDGNCENCPFACKNDNEQTSDAETSDEEISDKDKNND